MERAAGARSPARYSESLDGVLGLPVVHAAPSPVWHLYVVRHPDRDAFQERLGEAGVETLIHYPTAGAPDRRVRGPAGRRRRRSRWRSELSAEVLSLPMGPHLSDEDVAEVVAAVRACA